MSADLHKPGAAALSALLSSSIFGALGEKDFAAAAGLLTRKLMNAAGQTVNDMRALREAVGVEIFETQLKSLTPHQARLLARRLDKSVPDLEVSTAGAACAFIRSLINGTATAPAEADAPAEAEADTPAAPPAEATPETATETPAEPTPKPASSGSYFGRRSFRTGN